MKKQHFQTILKTGTAILLCGMVLTGCGTKNQQNVTTNITTVGNTALEQPMRLEALKNDGTDYQAYWGTKIQCITRGEHGYYYLTPEEPLYLMYWDDDTQESIKLCAKADCNHDNAACNAYFGDVRYYDRTAQAAEYASGFQIYYYNGFLYLLGTEGNLIQVSPDGSERKRITKVYDYDGTSNTKLVFYENAVYVYNSAGNQGSSEEHTETITRYTLDGKSQERVVEWNAVSGAVHSVKNYGNTMFFLLSGLTIDKNESGQQWTYTYQGLYAYNYQTGQSGKVIDAEITAYAVDEEQEQIYYFVYADGLYVYDIKQSRPGNSMMQEKKWVLQRCLMMENICICIMANGYPMQNQMKKQNSHENVLFLQQMELFYMNFRLTKQDICCLEMGIIFLPNRL